MSRGAGEDGFCGALEKMETEPGVVERSDGWTGGGDDDDECRSEGETGVRRGWG